MNNEEEAWLHFVVKDFEYVVKNYPEWWDILDKISKDIIIARSLKQLEEKHAPAH